MNRVVPYPSDVAIETDAARLVAEYAYTRNVVIASPIPIEDIVEKHLKVRVEFDGAHRLSTCRALVEAQILTFLARSSSTRPRL